MLAGLALQHEEHHRHGKGRHHKGRRQVSYDLQSHQKLGGLSQGKIKQAPKTIFGVEESPLNNKPIHGHNNQTHESGSGVSGKTHENISREVNGYKMYFNAATRKWTRRPKKRPSWSPRPRKPSLSPSTSMGGRGGDLMGSGFDSNDPQCKNSLWAHVYSYLM